jgi:Flp pilus assembly protein TadD
MFGLNSATGVLDVTTSLLESRLALARGDSAAEITAIRQAVAASDLLDYDEPPDFYYPVRESLGGALLRANRPAEAEAVFREDLSLNPDNPRSLFGLGTALTMQNRKDEATPVLRAYQSKWSDADQALMTADL